MINKIKRTFYVCFYLVDELTLRFVFICAHTLSNHNFTEPVICHLQHKAAIDHTVPGFEPPVDDIAVVQVLHPLTNQFKSSF